MTVRYFPKSLAFVAFSAYFVGILQKRRPIEPRLEHLHGGLLGSKMTSTCILIAVTEYSLLFFLRHTSSNYLISTIFARMALPNNRNESLQRRTSCPMPSNQLVFLLLPRNWQCELTMGHFPQAVGTPQETHHLLEGCGCCVLWLVTKDDLQQHSPPSFYP